MATERHALSENNLKGYTEGCEQVAYALNDAVKAVLGTGKKPTIVIPSRGAVPITVLALNYLKELDADHVLLDPERSRYYPENVFASLSNGRIHQNGSISSEVDVVLYPFTADVTSEGAQEYLAQKLRYSATKALLDLIAGDRKSLDLNWYFCLMEKMNPRAYKDINLNPIAVAQSLKELQSRQDRQVIIIDTVISGRAASHIVSAFRELGHPALPILAVDSTDGEPNSLKPALKREVSDKMAWWEYMKDDCPKENAFVKFPLITEDKGAALLGLVAVNFRDFNTLGRFHEIDARFPHNFVPQSCVWALPPSRTALREPYMSAFHEFLRKCFPASFELPMTEPEWKQTKSLIESLMRSKGDVCIKLAEALAMVGKEAYAHESSSHIISIDMPPVQYRKWVKEFAEDLEEKRIFTVR